MLMPSKVVWIDDFIGARLDARYEVVCPPYCQAQTYGLPGGALLLFVPDGAAEVVRCRFGGDAGSGDVIDARNWLPASSPRYECKLFYTRTDLIQTSVGFAGPNDPSNYCEFYYYAPEGQWTFCLAKGGADKSFNTGFIHTPNVSFVLRFEINGTTTPYATVSWFINDSLIGSYTGPEVPTQVLCPEWNLYNQPTGGTPPYSNCWMFADYVYIDQNR